MGQTPNKMQEVQGSDVNVQESKNQVCQKYTRFLYSLKTFIKPKNPFLDVGIQFYSDKSIQIENKTEADIGKVRRIDNGILRDPESGRIIDLDKIDYNDGTNLSDVLGINIDGNNSLTQIFYQSNNRINATNRNRTNGNVGLFYGLDCDAKNKCTCYFS